MAQQRSPKPQDALRIWRMIPFWDVYRTLPAGIAVCGHLSKDKEFGFGAGSLDWHP
jgi:hypothetical protein